MKVLITGARGQLGADIMDRCQAIGMITIGIGRADVDITDEEVVKEFIRSSRPDAVIHCAAYTAVDRAEEERELCFKVNVLGTKYISEVCAELDIKLIYISTDYTFDGSGELPWRVDSVQNPVNFYGESKYLGEMEIKKCLKKYFIVRISWVFGKNGTNFIKTMLKLESTLDAEGNKRNIINVVSDQIGSPTYTYDVAKLLCEMLQTDEYGAYHATNEGYCSWYDLACFIFDEAGIDIKVNAISTKDYTARAARPLNSRMDKSKLDTYGFERLPVWQNAVKRYIKELEFI